MSDQTRVTKFRAAWNFHADKGQIVLVHGHSSDDEHESTLRSLSFESFEAIQWMLQQYKPIYFEQETGILSTDNREV